VQRGALYLGFSHKTRIGLEVLQVELERLIMGHLLLIGKKKKNKKKLKSRDEIQLELKNRNH
jgi:hypothetical protein